MRFSRRFCHVFLLLNLIVRTAVALIAVPIRHPRNSSTKFQVRVRETRGEDFDSNVHDNLLTATASDSDDTATETLAKRDADSSVTWRSTAVATQTIYKNPQTWFGLLRRRMWTKMDFFHLHALSGIAFSLFGSVWVLDYIFKVLNEHSVPSSPDAFSLILLAVGVLNCLTCFPMTLNPNQAGGFKYLGIGMTLNAIWQSTWVSGYYPAFLGNFDRIVAGLFLTLIGFGIWDSEAALTRELQKFKEGKNKFRNESKADIVLNHRYAPSIRETVECCRYFAFEIRAASYPNLLHLPVLYNILFGGRAWLERVEEVYPLEHSLLFHACFAISVSNSIIFLCATLKDRKLITLRQWLYLQLVMISPVITTVIDSINGDDKVSIDPTHVYTGFI